MFNGFPCVLDCVIRVASLAFLIESLEENLYFSIGISCMALKIRFVVDSFSCRIH